MSEITIPPKALEAAARSRYERFVDMHPGYQWPTWDSMTDPIKAEMIDQQKAACLALLRAWPGMVEVKNGSSMNLRPQIILPLTENSNER